VLEVLLRELDLVSVLLLVLVLVLALVLVLVLKVVVLLVVLEELVSVLPGPHFVL
jgi:hypothetical protein